MTMYRAAQGKIVGRQEYTQGSDLRLMQGKVFDANGNMCYGKVNDFRSTPIVEQNLNKRGESGNIVGRVRVVTFFDAERLYRFTLYRENDVEGYEMEWDYVMDGEWESTGEVHTLEHCSTFNEVRVGQRVQSFVQVCTRGDSAKRLFEPMGNDGRNARVTTTDPNVEEMLIKLCSGVWIRTSTLLKDNITVELIWLAKRDLCFRTTRRYVDGNWHSSRFATERRRGS